tara:strand:+ start:197 stop:397 length:201 start_codon:yes stop_codon:yes gene_type:complete
LHHEKIQINNKDRHQEFQKYINLLNKQKILIGTSKKKIMESHNNMLKDLKKKYIFVKDSYKKEKGY